MLAIFWAAFFLVYFNIAMMIPLAPYVQASVGLTTAQVGWMLAAFPVTALVGNLAVGPWIDRFGRKRFLVLGGGLSAVMFALTAAATTPTTLILCRAAMGLCMPMLGAAIFAAIADYLPPERRARATGLVTAAAPIAFLLCMPLGAVLGAIVSWRVPVLLAGAVAAAVALAAWHLPPTPPGAMSPHPVTARTYADRVLALSLSRATRRFFTGCLLWAGAVFIFLGFYASWAVQHGLAAQDTGRIGLVLFLGETGGLAGALLSGHLAQIALKGLTSRPLALAAIAALATAAAMIVVPLGPAHIAFQSLAYFAFAFGRDMTLALLLGGAMQLVPATLRASLNAVFNAVYQGGAALGVLAGAALYALRPDFLANAAAATVLLAAAAIAFRRVDRP